MSVLRCRICNHGEAISLGEIPNCGEFAGQQVSPAIKGGELWKCQDCGSMFRYPSLSPAEYLALYEKASSEVWEGSESLRKDFATINKCLDSHVGGSILDIGCYAGGFLAGISDKFKKYGVEPSGLASKSAAFKGINILGRTLADLECKSDFDVVVSIDVIEHVLDIEAFLVDALARVNKSGILIISTGNPDCFYWKRIFKAKFWYCSYPEHLTFPSYKYFSEFARRHGLSPPEQIRFKYMELKFMERFSKFIRYATFSFSPAIYQVLRIMRGITGRSTSISSGAPVSPIGVFSDHQVIIFKNQ